MKKIDKNSPNRQNDDTLLYLLLFFSVVVLVGVGVYHYWPEKNKTQTMVYDYTELGNRVVAPDVKETSKLLSDNRSREKTIRRLLNSKNRRKELPTSEKEAIRKELDEKISATNKIVGSVDLNTVGPEFLADVYSRLYEQGKTLIELKTRVCDDISYEELRKQLDVTQKKWQIPFAEEQEIRQRMNEWITTWYHQAMEGKEKMKEYIRPFWYEGREIGEYFSPADVAPFRKIHEYKNEDGSVGQIDLSRPLQIEFGGYDGFVSEKENKDSTEGTAVFGLTLSDPLSVLGPDDSEKWKPGFTKFAFISNNYRGIRIKLKKEIFFNRLGYDEWLIKVYRTKDGGYRRSFFDISFDQVVETIAHELAHAVINSMEGNYEGEEGGGHGKLHTDMTEEIEAMMRKSPEFSEFEDWWNKKKNNG